MKKLIAVILLSCTYFAQAQSKKIDLCIQAMNNSEFIIDHSKKASFSVESKGVAKLLRIGKSANAKLIEALKDPSKNIIAYYTLCQINFKAVSFAGPKTIRKDGEEVSMYYLGEEKGEGFVIYETKVKDVYNMYFDKPSVGKISTYWENKIAVK